VLAQRAVARTPLVGRAQWETDSGRREALFAQWGEGETSELGGSIYMCGALAVIKVAEQGSPSRLPNDAKLAS